MQAHGTSQCYWAICNIQSQVHQFNWEINAKQSSLAELSLFLTLEKRTDKTSQLRPLIKTDRDLTKTVLLHIIVPDRINF